MPGWDKTKALVDYEWTQLREEGRDLRDEDALRDELNAAGEDENKFLEVWETLLALPMRDDFAFDEPSDSESIKALRPEAKTRRFAINDDPKILFDKMHGAWIGRCVGCALGKPVEGFMGAHNGISSKERIKYYLLGIDGSEYPLRDYFPQNSPATEQTGKVGCPLSTREQIAFMESDDDIRYTVIGQMIMRQKGPDFSTSDVANAWISHLPYRMVCTAETQAYRNLVNRYEWHIGSGWDAQQDIDWNWVATHQNPYREWIGAQIRVDSYGYAAPGNPELAAEFAWRDARLSHVKNGIYGAMLCAAMIAAAFALDDPKAIVEAGLNEIPQTSRLYQEMRQVIAICEKHNNDFANFEKVLDEIYDLLGHYHPVHTNNNAALCIAAVLLSGGDFEKGITLAVMGGWDSDCNGATVGSIVGAITGAQNAPTHWTARLNDTLKSQIIDYHPIAISECARRSVEISKIVAARS